MRRRSLIALALVAAAQAAPAGASSGEKKKGGGESFLQLPTLTATLFRPDGRRGVMTVEAGLDVPDGNLRNRAEASEPRLRDAYVRFLQAYAASAAPGSPPNPDVVGAALQRATDQVLGRPGAKLLLGTIMAH